VSCYSYTTCSPQQPTAFMIDALWTTRYLMFLSAALRTRSEWVVALRWGQCSINHYTITIKL